MLTLSCVFDKIDKNVLTLRYDTQWCKILKKLWKSFKNVCFLHTTGVRPIILLYVFDTDIAQSLFFTMKNEGFMAPPAGWRWMECGWCMGRFKANLLLTKYKDISVLGFSV